MVKEIKKEVKVEKHPKLVNQKEVDLLFTSKPRLAIIDVDFIPFYVCHNKSFIEIDKDTGLEQTIIENKSLDECIWRADDFIKNINYAVGSDFFTGFQTKGKCFRYSIYPLYKANRIDLAIPKHLNEVKEYLKNTYGFTSNSSYEADDLILSLSKSLSKDYDCVIVSPDKDLLNLEGVHFNPRRMEYKVTTVVDAIINQWEAMIVGDPGDNIKGCFGKGKATFEIIKKDFNSLEMFPEDYFRNKVLDLYVKVYGEYEGIKEFYKNYICLKIIDTIELRTDDYVLNSVSKEVCEQTKEDTG